MAPSIAPSLLSSPLAPGQVRGFDPQVLEALEALIATKGSDSPGYDGAKPPVAVFDWDNTVIRHDIGEAVLIDGLLEGWIKMPTPIAPEGWLTPEWQGRLEEGCAQAGEGGSAPEGQVPKACAEDFLRAYNEGFMADPEGNFLHRPYAWAALLLAGYSPGEISAFTDGVASRRLGADIGAVVEVGALETPGWMRLNPPMVALIQAFEAKGFEVWIVSASAQPLVEVMGARVGVPRERVIGVRLKADDSGRLLPELAPGPSPCPEGGVMTWRQGKACYIEAIIGRSPAFVAGDSVTDLEMLELATDLRLVLDRGKEPLMTRGRANADGKWAIQSLFYP